MGKPVKKSADQAPRPPKRQREVTPPSESSHDETDDAQPIPAADIALLMHLRHEEVHGSFRAHQSFGKKYRALFSQLLTQSNELVLRSVQPLVAETLKKAKYLPDEDDSTLSFYNTVLVNASRIVRKKVQEALDMKLTSVALRNTQEAGVSEAKAAVIPFGAEDLMPAPRFGVQSDAMFTRFLTAITARCFADEAAIDTLPSPGNEAFHCLEYTFHFASQESSKPFRNSTLRQRFFFQGGVMYRQAVPTFGRLIDIHVDTIDWKSDESKADFLNKSDHLGWFRTFFSGLLPRICEKDGDVAVPPHHYHVRTILEKYLGTTAAIPSSELCTVDIEVLQRRFEGRGVTVELPPFVDQQNIEDAQDAASKDAVWLQNFVSGRVAKYFGRIQALGTKAATSKSLLTEAEEWDVVRLVVLVNAALRGSATELLLLAATQPVAVAMAYPPGSDGAEDDEHDPEFGEGDEEEEDDEEDDDEEEEGDEEEVEEAPPQPPSRAPGKKSPQPECKHQ